ncbi:MAG: histidine kinase [Candidatus Nomurabacteria bacterium]|nr:histidine kinase [Candidatus Nomurabacteria bacterium]
MKKAWKHFEEWAIALRSNIFVWTRIKLTALYLLIIILTLAIYSAAMYFSLINNVRHEFVETADQVIRHQVYEAAVDHIQFQIITIDIVIFLFASIGSYILAGVTLKPVKRSLEAQEAFSADASHELRTPLAVMKTEIEVLLRSKEMLSENVKNVLRSNLEELNNLTTMTSDLLELSRGKSVKAGPLILSTIVQQQVSQLQGLAVQKKIELSFTASLASKEAVINGEKQALGRIFKNIIANALTYTREGGLVTVSVERSYKDVLVTIVDNGIGISEKDLPHIFKRFYKADNARSGSGTGLGLALTKDIVEQYHGTINIKSELGNGTIVVVTLPVKQ